MVSSIKANSVLQSYAANNLKALNSMQPVATTLAQQSSESTRIIFSPATREKLELNLALSAYQNQISDTKKDRARERAAEIKQRIEELKGLMTLFGAMVPKALLRELKQLANQLKSIANELKEGSAGSTGAAIGESLSATESKQTVRHPEHLDKSAAYDMETMKKGEGLSNDETGPVKNEAVQSDASTRSLPYQTGKEQSQQQRRADQRLLQETAQKLQSLFNRLKALLRKEDNDKQMQNQLDEIEKLLTDTNSIATQLTSSIEVTKPNINIAISV